MTTPERKAQLQASFHHRAAIAKTFGMTLSFPAEGGAAIDLPYNPNLDHALGGVHGGVVMTLIDSAAWFTAASTHPENVWVATSELSVHLLLPVKETSLRAMGQILKAGKRQDIVEARVTDGEGRLVAHGVGTFILLPNVPMNPTGDQSGA